MQSRRVTELEWAAEALLDIPGYQEVWKDRDVERNVLAPVDRAQADKAKSTSALLPLPPQIAVTAESLVGTAVLPLCICFSKRLSLVQRQTNIPDLGICDTQTVNDSQQVMLQASVSVPPCQQ